MKYLLSPLLFGVFMAGIWLIFNMHAKDMMAQDMYIDENALMASQSRGVHVSEEDLSAIEDMLFHCKNSMADCASLLLESLGMEISKTCYPVTHFAREKQIGDWIPTSLNPCVVTGILRAPRGDGKESIVISTELPYVMRPVLGSRGKNVTTLLRPVSALKPSTLENLRKVFNTSSFDIKNLIPPNANQIQLSASSFSTAAATIRSFARSKALSRDIVLVAVENIGHTSLRVNSITQDILQTVPQNTFITSIEEYTKNHDGLRELVRNACSQYSDACPWNWEDLILASMKSPWFAIDSLRLGSQIAQMALNLWLEDVLNVSTLKNQQNEKFMNSVQTELSYVQRQEIKQNLMKGGDLYEKRIRRVPQFGRIIAALSLDIPSSICPKKLNVKAVTGTGRVPNLDLVAATIHSFGPASDAHMPSVSVSDSFFGKETLNDDFAHVTLSGIEYYFSPTKGKESNVVLSRIKELVPYLLKTVSTFFNKYLFRLSSSIGKDSFGIEQLIRAFRSLIEGAPIIRPYSFTPTKDPSTLDPMERLGVYIRSLNLFSSFLPIFPNNFSQVASDADLGGLKRFAAEQMFSQFSGLHEPFLNHGIDSLTVSVSTELTPLQYEHGLKNMIVINQVTNSSVCDEHGSACQNHSEIPIALNELFESPEASSFVCPFALMGVGASERCLSGRFSRSLGVSVSIWLQIANNIHEKLHHSQNFYMLMSDHTFLVGGKYQIILLLLTLPLLIHIILRLHHQLGDLKGSSYQNPLGMFERICPTLILFLVHILVLNCFPLLILPSFLCELNLQPVGHSSTLIVLSNWIFQHILWYMYILPRLMIVFTRRAWLKKIYAIASDEYLESVEKIRRDYKNKREAAQKDLESVEATVDYLRKTNNSNEPLSEMSISRKERKIQRARMAKYKSQDPPHSLLPSFKCFLYEVISRPEGRFIPPLATVTSEPVSKVDYEKRESELEKALNIIEKKEMLQPEDSLAKISKLRVRLNPSSPLGPNNYSSVSSEFRFLVKNDESLFYSDTRLPIGPEPIFSWTFFWACVGQLNPFEELAYCYNILPRVVADDLMSMNDRFLTKMQRNGERLYNANGTKSMPKLSGFFNQTSNMRMCLHSVLQLIFYGIQDFFSKLCLFCMPRRVNCHSMVDEEDLSSIDNDHNFSLPFFFRLAKSDECLDWIVPDIKYPSSGAAAESQLGAWTHNSYARWFRREFGKLPESEYNQVSCLLNNINDNIKDGMNVVSSDGLKSEDRQSDKNSICGKTAKDIVSRLFYEDAVKEAHQDWEIGAYQSSLSGLKVISQANVGFQIMKILRELRRRQSAIFTIRKDTLPPSEKLSNWIMSSNLSNCKKLKYVLKNTVKYSRSEAELYIKSSLEGLFDGLPLSPNLPRLRKISKYYHLYKELDDFAKLSIVDTDQDEEGPCYPLLRSDPNPARLVPLATLGRLADHSNGVNILNLPPFPMTPLSGMRLWYILLSTLSVFLIFVKNSSLGLCTAIVLSALILGCADSYDLGTLRGFNCIGGVTFDLALSSLRKSLRSQILTGLEYFSTPSHPSPDAQVAFVSITDLIFFFWRWIVRFSTSKNRKQLIMLGIFSPFTLAALYHFAISDKLHSSNFICAQNESVMDIFSCLLQVSYTNTGGALYLMANQFLWVFTLLLLPLYMFCLIATFSVPLYEFYSSNLKRCIFDRIQQWHTFIHDSDIDIPGSNEATSNIEADAIIDSKTAGRQPIVVGGVGYGLNTFYPIFIRPKCGYEACEPIVPIPDCTTESDWGKIDLNFELTNLNDLATKILAVGAKETILKSALEKDGSIPVHLRDSDKQFDIFKKILESQENLIKEISKVQNT